MINREKVIKGIDICLQRFHCGQCCPYYDDCEIGCMEQLRKDALALLKEQEVEIKRLEHDLAVAQDSLNYYVNRNS